MSGRQALGASERARRVPHGARRAGAALVGSAGLVLTMSACSGGSSSSDSSNVTATSPTTSVSSGATATKGGGSVPVSLRIPSIKFDKKVVGMGLAPNGEIAPPQGLTQWYNATVSPGQPGISVIAGHVTYNNVPDVFANLENVHVGDTVSVGYADGSKKDFVVTREKSVDKNQLRTDQTVWGASSTPVLTLITCDGKSKVVGEHHVNNFVVWTKPKGS